MFGKAHSGLVLRDIYLPLVRNNAPYHSRQLEKLEKFFLSQGFKFARQVGSHRSYVKDGISRPVIIPSYNEVPVSIITRVCSLP